MVEGMRVFYRPTIGDCKCEIVYDGHDQLLFNLDLFVCDEVLRPRQHIIRSFWRRLLPSSWDFYPTTVVNDTY